MGPVPERNQAPPAFSVIVADVHSVTFLLVQRNRNVETSWQVSVTIEGDVVAHQAGPDRRVGHWTRGRLEDVLLTLLGAYERGLTA